MEDQPHLPGVEDSPPGPPSWEPNYREREQSVKDGRMNLKKNTRVCSTIRLIEINNMEVEFRCGPTP